MRRQPPALAVLAGLLALLSSILLVSCGEDEPEGGGGDDPVTVDITFSDGSVTPSGERVDVGVGQPVDLVVTADEPGEIHVHSAPEQTFEYESGTTVLKLEVARPGVVEVESHDLDQVIMQLEVR